MGTMDAKNTRNYMRCLAIRCKELNELHNDFDIDTRTETEYRNDILADIKYFNNAQETWCAELKTTSKGWYIKYE